MASDIIAPTRALVLASRISLAVLDDTVLYEDEIASTMRYGRASKALNTLISYQCDWRQFVAWAEQKGIEPLPCQPGMLCAYLSALADRGLSAATIERHRAAIGHYYWINGSPSPAGHDGFDRDHARYSSHDRQRAAPAEDAADLRPDRQTDRRLSPHHGRHPGQG